MRAVVGFIALHIVLVAVGAAWLDAIGLMGRPGRGGHRAWPALGAAFLAGVAIVVPTLIVGLVVGAPLTVAGIILTSAAWIAVARIVRTRIRAPALGGPAQTTTHGLAADGLSGRERLAARLGLAALTGYAAVGAIALAMAPTRGDDARIWSLRGLTLSYYGRLQPEIFLNPGQSGAHPVYPLLQPVLEAALSRSVGYPALRLYHTELWLLFGATVWTAGYLLWHAPATAPVIKRLMALAPIITLAVVTPMVTNLVSGYADTTASMMLGVGALAFGLWIESEQPASLFMAAVMLTGAASTKNEDLLGALCVLVVGALATLARRGESHGLRRRRLMSLAALAAWFAAFVAPWRIWLKAHHLTDSVQPSIPRALEPSFLFHRGHQLDLTATWMLDKVLRDWDWLAAVFIVTTFLCLRSGVARRVAAFYLASFGLIVIGLLWLYASTPLSLAFLLPTSMARTVSVFMVLAVTATAHLLRVLLDERSDTGRAKPRPEAGPRPEATTVTR